MTVLYYPPTQNGLQKSLSSQLDEGVTASMTLNNTTGVANEPGVVVVNRIDSGGTEKEAAAREFISYTGTSGSTLTGLTRGIGGSSDQDHATGSVVEFVPDITVFQAIIDALANLVDPDDIDTFQDLTSGVTAASVSAAGKVELATAAETTTGTDATRAVTPDGLAGSAYGKRIVALSVFDSDTAVATGDGTIGIPIPSELNGYNIVGVQANVYEKGVTGTTDVQIRRQRGATDVDVLSVKITIGDEYYASDGTINTSNDDLATGDMLFADVDAVHSGTAPNGLSVTIIAQLP